MIPGIAAGMLSGRRQLQQVTFGAAGAGANTSGGTLSLPYPSGIVSASFLLFHVYNGGTGLTEPSGWSRIPTGLGAGTSPYHGYWRQAIGDETGNLDLTIGGAGIAVGRLYRFSHGIGVESPNDVSNVAGSTSSPAEDVTTLGKFRMAVQLMFGIANTTIGDCAGESGADYTEAVAEYAGAAPINFCMSCQVAQVPDPTAITGGAATFGASATSRSTIGFAIIP